jgi:hypothetical protein
MHDLSAEILALVKTLHNRMLTVCVGGESWFGSSLARRATLTAGQGEKCLVSTYGSSI